MTFLAGCDGGGIGQSFDSPNGEYAASAMPFYGNNPRIEYRITDNKTGWTVWKHDEAHNDKTDPPYGAGFGDLELIQWSEDSREVRFATKCRDTFQVTEWMSAKQDEQNKFVEGVRCGSGLRPVNRNQQVESE